MLEAAIGHAQNGVHAFHQLAEGAGIQPHDNLARVRDSRRRKTHFVRDSGFQASVEYPVLLAAVGHHFDFPHHDIRGVTPAVHMRGQRQFESPDALRLHGELRRAHAPRIHCHAFAGGVVHQREPVFLFQIQVDIPARRRIVVHGHRNRDEVALREGDRQIQVHKEILEDLQARYAAAQCTMCRRGHHRHAPRGYGIR